MDTLSCLFGSPKHSSIPRRRFKCSAVPDLMFDKIMPNMMDHANYLVYLGFNQARRQLGPTMTHRRYTWKTNTKRPPLLGISVSWAASSCRSSWTSLQQRGWQVIRSSLKINTSEHHISTFVPCLRGAFSASSGNLFSHFFLTAHRRGQNVCEDEWNMMHPVASSERNFWHSSAGPLWPP